MRLGTSLTEAGQAIEITDARELPFLPCDGRDLTEYPTRLKELAERLACADGVVIASPVHYYSASGFAKNLIEIVGESLAGKPLALISAAGSLRSHLALGGLALALMQEVDAVIFPPSLQVTGANGDCSAERVEDFANRFAVFVATQMGSR